MYCDQPSLLTRDPGGEVNEEIPHRWAKQPARKKIGWSVDRYKKVVNAGVFASKYNFGISNSRYEASRCHIATCSKRKSA